MLLDVKEDIIVDRKGRSFSFEFEDNDTSIMTGGKEVLRRMASEDPETLVLTAEGVEGSSLRQVPHAETFVLRVGDDQVLLGMKDDAADVVVVPSAAVNLPRLRLVHAPELDEAVISAGDDQWHRRVKGGPVDASIMALEDVFDVDVRRAKKVRRVRVLEVVISDATRTRGDVLLAETANVPDTDRLVERSRHNQILGRVKLGAHDVVIVASENADARSRLPVPDANRLVV